LIRFHLPKQAISLCVFMIFWINALEFCESRGSKSNLVHITNQTVQAEVKLLLANMKLPCGGVWIGLERSIFEWSAPWLWTSSDVDKVVMYSEWHSCFPLNPINYHCGKMVRVGNGELKWLDASCHQELPFICQVSYSILLFCYDICISCG
uniref:C-type lectin domain-containing protein n=1 Tax=Hucho hucho TaxID=62062 RepID=A0A4W5R1G3_9TELE